MTVFKIILATFLLMISSCIYGANLFESSVSDLTNTLTQIDKDLLKSEIDQIEAELGITIQISMIATTNGEDIAAYATRIGNQIHGFSSKKSLLIVVAKSDRKMRIAVSRDLSKTIPDRVAKQIIDKIITPRFKELRYNKGLLEGVVVIKKLLRGEVVAEVTSGYKYWILAFIIPFIFIIEIFKRTIKGKMLVKFLGFGGYFAIGTLAINWGVGLGFAFIMFMISFLLLKYPKKRLVIRKDASSVESRVKQQSQPVLLSFLGFIIVSENSINPVNGIYNSGGHATDSSSFGTGGGGGFGGGGGGGGFGGGGASGSW